MIEILVRHARPDDQPELQSIFRRASLANPGDRDALLAHPEVLQLPNDLVSRGRTLVATVTDEMVIGFASTTEKGASALELEDLFVDPDWQRRGAARRLLAQILVEAAAEGVTRIDVIANDHALAFYGDAGFVEDHLEKTPFGVGTRMHLDVPARPPKNGRRG